MKQKLLISLLAIAWAACGFSVRATEMDSMIWWDLKSDSGYSSTSPQKHDSLVLCRGKFPFALHDGEIISRARAWIKTPDSIISEVNLSSEKRTISFDFPDKITAAGPGNPYIVGIHVNAGLMDIDSGVTEERIDYYSKYIICHQNEQGVQGNGLDLFFRDPDKIALEIGPADNRSIKGKPYMKIGYQEALKEYKMKVLYKGRPLADVEVALMTESGWAKRAKTDSNGMVSITPIENKGEEEKCLYVVTHKDLSTGRYYCSSLMMHVMKPPPSWMSKAGWFDFWAALGSGLFIVYVTAAVYRMVKRDKKTMLEFESHKIKRD